MPVPLFTAVAVETALVMHIGTVATGPGRSAMLGLWEHPWQQQ